ncbi:PSR [Symbiodinium microadriaticum]|nr:PSR [Symbiodinium microadriaticum]
MALLSKRTGLDPEDDFTSAADCLLVLPNSFQEASSNFCCKTLLEEAGCQEVEYKRAAQGELSLATDSLSRVLCDFVPNSCHEDPVLLMDENVVSTTSLANSLLEAAPPFLREDLFCEFPLMLRPAQLCLVVGGQGARSDLHIDPLSWTGWNCLLQGRKLWRFFPDIPQHAEAFRPASRPFGIRKGGAEVCTIGSGWRSDVDLFANRTNTAAEPPCDSFGWLSPDLAKFPHVKGCSAPLEHVQEPGETLIFPGHWWHQTYHLTPTFGFAGQVLNSGNLGRVLGHIIRWCELEVPDEAWDQEPKAFIAQVLGEAIDSMHVEASVKRPLQGEEPELPPGLCPALRCGDEVWRGTILEFWAIRRCLVRVWADLVERIRSGPQVETLGVSYFGNDITLAPITEQVEEDWREFIHAVKLKSRRSVFVIGGFAAKYRGMRLSSAYDQNQQYVKSLVESEGLYVTDLWQKVKKWKLCSDGIRLLRGEVFNPSCGKALRDQTNT